MAMEERSSSLSAASILAVSMEILGFSARTMLRAASGSDDCMTRGGGLHSRGDRGARGGKGERWGQDEQRGVTRRRQ